MGRLGKAPVEDWPIILAHELSHYFFGLLDVYLGFEDELLVTTGSCQGSTMGDTYNPNNTEFIYDDGYWTNNDFCGQTLPHRDSGPG